MQYTHTLGIDVSKRTFDLALSQNLNHGSMISNKFDNNLQGYKKLVSWLKKEGVSLDHLLVCLENTGIYHRGLVDFLQQQLVFVWVENPRQIKCSIGIQKGKTDALDAKRICLYALKNQDNAKNYQPNEKELQAIADLLALRDRLITAKAAIEKPIKELRDMNLLEDAIRLEKACESSLKELDKNIVEIEAQIKTILNSGKELNNNYQYALSVQGVGMITALQILVSTHNFKRFEDAKKLACYSGVVPHPHQSGTSVKKKARVDHMANKTLKKVLHMCALSAIRCKGDFKTYFERKVKEGKNKMLILNAIRNKILHRIFACIRDQRIYVPIRVKS
jgi:transposase